MSLLDYILGIFKDREIDKVQKAEFENHGYALVDYEAQNEWLKYKISEITPEESTRYVFTGRRYKYIVYFDCNKKYTIYKKLKPNRFEPIRKRINFLKANGHRVLLVNNQNAVNPTFDELVRFLDVDKTETLEYIPGKFVCGDFAQLLHNRAEKQGIKAGWVHVEFTHDGIDHACNVFNTIDRGLVFVDATGIYPNDEYNNTDKIVEIKRYESYTPRAVHPSADWVYNTMGIVKNYKIFW